MNAPVRDPRPDVPGATEGATGGATRGATRGANGGPGERTSRLVHVFFISAALSAGGMFVFKLFSFLKTIKRDEMAGFAFDPIVTYGFVAMGFLFLLAWAYLTGQFRNIEQPKHEMLARFHEQERLEALAEGRDD